MFQQRKLSPAYAGLEIRLLETSAEAICTDVIGAISGETICTNMVCAISSNTICTNMISAVSSNTVGTNMVGTVSGNTVGTNMVGTVSSNTVGTYVVCAISGNTVGTYVVRTVSSEAADISMRGAVFGNYRCIYLVVGIHTWKCESASCHDRESEAEDQFVGFHGSCSRSIQLVGNWVWS